MTVRRIMGTEVEYGISVPGHPNMNAMNLSSQVVTAYAAAAEPSVGARWDYEEEHPLRDARGFELDRGVVDAAALTDEDPGLANVILTNGARLYVDHAHPEYSTPEVTAPWDVVLWDKAGERVMHTAGVRASTAEHPINLYKNNTDNKGASYGSHENYLLARSTPFAAIVQGITPFFVTRQVFCGSGRVGIGQDGRTEGFQLSQRADFIEAEVGLETTLKRPLVNTRDEPHADAQRYRRFHVIVGDANLSELATYLKVATTSLVLAMIEAGRPLDHLAVADPVGEVKRVSHDPTLRHRLRLVDGRQLTALEVQLEYLEAAHKYVADTYGADVDGETQETLARWEEVLIELREEPRALADRLDWVAKLALLEGYRRRDGLDWGHPRLALVDLQYSDVRPDKGLYHRLVASGRMQTFLADERITHAMSHAPEDTRAWFRGECLRRFGPQISAASWDSLVFDVPGRVALARVPTLDPYRGTRAHTEALLDRCSNVGDLLTALGE
jgi:proteasome accessory factor A